MLDFSKRKKRYFEFVLHDGTQLSIPAPTLGISADIVDAMSNKSMAGVTGYKNLEKILIDVLSSNKQRINVTNKQVREFGLDEVVKFFGKYMNFTNEVTSDPNLKSLAIQEKQAR